MIGSVWRRLAALRLEIIILLIVGLAALAKDINEAPLVDWDEATYAEVVHEAVASHSYLDFTWNGQPYLKKPPLLFWSVIASTKAFGEHEWSVRLPSVLFGVGTILLIYIAAAAVAGRVAGLCAGLMPLGFYFFIARGGRECATDAPLVFFSMLAIYALSRARSDRRWIALTGAACGLAILSKGLAGLIPLATAVISLLWLPAFAEAGISAVIMLLGVTTIVAAPWFLHQVLTNMTLFWSTFIEQETLARIANHLEDQPQTPGYTFWTFGGEIAHLWPILLPLAGLAIASLRRDIVRLIRDLPPAIVIWSLWFVLALGAACAVQTKLGWYILPSLIPVALLGGAILGAAITRDGAARRYCMPLGAAALALILIQAPGQSQLIEQGFSNQRDSSRPSYILGVEARERAAYSGGNALYFGGIPLPTLVYYSGMPCYFQTPAPLELETTDLDGNAINVGYHDLVMRDPDGSTITIGNFDEVWNTDGPAMERSPSSDSPTVPATAVP
ncbi:MAG TPA: glycosyltransferase family 39 protein [Candidatus Binataceae bacterium]|nr:glycosyltransferase family 39 protein [Candidatus Binataceae bacterium]